MLTALRKRLDARSEKGFTLIELLVVIIIIGILLAIAVPSFLGFRDRANRAAAQANLRSAIPAIETFFADFDTYAGVENATTGAIVYDAGLQVTWGAAAQQTATSYCVTSEQGGFEYYKLGPAGGILEDTTPGTTPCVV